MMRAQHHPAQVLIADDDPITLAFFQATLEQLGCNAVAAASGEQALCAARTRTFDLLVLDRRMPDIGGSALLGALRAQGNQSAAIATSAEVDAATIEELWTGGFHTVLPKPLSREQLVDAIKPLLPETSFASTPTSTSVLLDDANAIAASGADSAILAKLRGLLVLELEQLPGEISNGFNGTNSIPLRDRLHRLKASCGFCGASALALATTQLDQALGATPHVAQSALGNLLRVCSETLDELRRQGTSLGADK